MQSLKKLLGLLSMLLVAGFLVPEHPRIPVQGASSRDWNPHSFWAEPWGKSGVHKGIDIFARKGTPVRASVPGVVLYRGQFGIGGNVIAILGPKWRIHYYAHLEESHAGMLVAKGQAIGAVGTTGDALGKPPHLHYSVISLIPLPWRMTGGPQGWKKMFFLDPGDLLEPAGKT
ncbi:M23 family metallopeptidase [Burkholderia pyrrocinia]|uniref:M23 family metallopeptidase n=1 Tax=Burkholderia pyrrocinia TaxID=60550 RepID=UPI001575AD05|nr:M23 family metallopeptidase [Burkholderia pyrrocinia]NTX26657.1 M23 family metallopeptidase [Burkholderia pyrrocinia]QVN23397.1 M23 family metallopeptidase [Burkholderia pyrrocinia]